MSTFSKTNNLPDGPVDSHDKSRTITMRQGVSIFPALVALLLLAALMLAWQPGRASAASEAPKFESVVTAPTDGGGGAVDRRQKVVVAR